MTVDKGNRRKGILYLIAACFFLALMSSCVRLAGDLPGPQKAFVRVLVMGIFSYVPFRRNGERLSLGKEERVPLILRGIFGAIAILLNFYAVDHMNLADANMLNKLSPFFAVFFSWIILKETFDRFDLTALIFALIGALLIVKPGGNAALVPALAGAMSGVGSGIGNTYVRAAAKAGASKEKVVLVYSIIACLITFPLMMTNFQPMTLKQILAMLACGICSTIGHELNVLAYANAPAHEISVFDYSQVVFAAIIGFALFGQIPDWLSVLGYAIIIGTGIVVFYFERKEKQHE